ncbi:MAG: hypothetical protein WC489_08070, partial [Patescibacteria group bacterium]
MGATWFDTPVSVDISSPVAHATSYSPPSYTELSFENYNPSYVPHYDDGDEYYEDYYAPAYNPPTIIDQQIAEFNKLVANAPSVGTVDSVQAARDRLKASVDSATLASRNLVSDALANIKTVEIPDFKPIGVNNDIVQAVIGQLIDLTRPTPDLIDLTRPTPDLIGRASTVDKAIANGWKNASDDIINQASQNYGLTQELAGNLANYISKNKSYIPDISARLDLLADNSLSQSKYVLSSLNDILPTHVDQQYYTAQDLISGAADVTKQSLSDLVASYERTISDYTGFISDKIAAASTEEEVDEYIRNLTNDFKSISDMYSAADGALTNNYSRFAEDIARQFGDMSGNLVGVAIASDYAEKDVSDKLSSLSSKFKDIIGSFTNGANDLAKSAAAGVIESAIPYSTDAAFREYAS